MQNQNPDTEEITPLTGLKYKVMTQKCNKTNKPAREYDIALKKLSRSKLKTLRLMLAKLVYVFQNIWSMNFWTTRNYWITSGFSDATWLWFTKKGKELTQVKLIKNIAVRLARTLKKRETFSWF